MTYYNPFKCRMKFSIRLHIVKEQSSTSHRIQFIFSYINLYSSNRKLILAIVQCSNK